MNNQQQESSSTKKIVVLGRKNIKPKDQMIVNEANKKREPS